MSARAAESLKPYSSAFRRAQTANYVHRGRRGWQSWMASKDADECMAMTLLGIQISIMKAGALLQLDAEKAARWAIHLEELLDLGTCEASFASKMAGRLSFAVCTCTDKIGRAYLRPFFQQAVSHDYILHRTSVGHAVSSCGT